MKKRILSAALSLAMLLPMMPVNALATEEEDNVLLDDALTENKVYVADSISQDREQLSDLELLEQYIYQQMGGDLGTTFSVPVGSGLTGNDKEVYDGLQKMILDIADGYRDSSLLTFDLQGKGVTGDVTATSISNIQGLDLDSVWKALLADCSAPLFWHDKTNNGLQMQFWYSGSEGTGKTLTRVDIGLAVAKEYAPDGKAGGTDIDLSAMPNLETVFNNIDNIITANSDKTDYEKLVAYKDAICDLVSYNSAAAGSGYTGDSVNPWQFLWVFDGKPSTNVVCEGYAKAFKLLCDLTNNFKDTNLSCYLVTGTMQGGTGAGLHMWNIVSTNSGNYLVDVTNCDGNSIGAPDRLFMKAPDAENGTNADYKFTIDSRNIVYYWYDADTKNQYTTSELTLASNSYAPISGLGNLAITVPPTNMTYTAGQSFDPAGMTVTATIDGANKELTSSEYTIIDGASLKYGQTTVTIRYGHLTATVEGLTVNKGTLAANSFGLSDSVFTYNGSTQVPEVIAPEGIAPRVTYKKNSVAVANPTDAGEYSVYVTFEGNDSYNALEETLVGTFAIQKRNVVIDAGDSVTVAVDNDYQLEVTTVPAGLSLTYSSDNTGVTVSPTGKLHGVTLNATATITIRYAGDDNNNTASATVDVTVTAKPAQTALTITGEKDIMAFNERLTLTATGGTGSGEITWSVNGSGAATVSPTTGRTVTLTPTHVGDITVTATKAGGSAYDNVEATYNVTITTADQDALTITGTGISGGKLTLTKGDTRTLGVTGGTLPGSEFTLESSDPTTVSVNNGVITALRGTVEPVTITATKAGNDNYNPVTATLEVTVTRANRNLSITGDGEVAYNSELLLSAAPDNGGGTVNWTVTDGTGSARIEEYAPLVRSGSATGRSVRLMPTRAGQVTVTATISGDTDYNDATASKTITITRADRALVITDPGTIVSGNSVQLTTTGGSDNGRITWSVEDDTDTATIDQNGKLTAGNAGTITVRATKAADNNYNESTASATITIAKADYEGNKNKSVMVKVNATDTQTVRVDLDGLYPAGSTVGTPRIDSGSIFTTAAPSVSGQTLSVELKANETGDGTITIPVTHPQYKDFDITVTITVTDMEIQNVSFAQSTVNKTYGDADFTNALTGAVGTVAYTSSNTTVADVNANTGAVTIKNAGTTVITVTAAATDTHAAGSASYTLNVAKKPLTISAVNRTAKVGESAPTIGSVQGTDYTVSGLVGDDTVTGVTVAYAAAPDTNIAGTSAIIVSGGTVTNASNYDITYVNGTLTVTSGTVTPPTPTPEPEPTTPSEDTSTDRKPSNSGGSSNSNSSNTGTSTRPDGSTVTTKTSSNGTVTTTVEAADGTVSETVTSPNGATEVSVSLPGRGEDTVTLPISQVQPVLNSSMAQEINISVPSSRGTVTAEIPVQNVTAGTVAVLVAPDGTETIVKTSVPTANGIALSVSGNVTVKVIDNTKPFGDVVSSDWHKDAVDFVSARGLFNGTGANTFSPNGTMTRGMIATVLYNLEGNPAASGAASFPDVSSGDWFASAVQWASGTGLMSGYTNGSFGANDAITREQLAVILWAHAGRPAVSGTLSFSDAASVSDYAQQAMLWATQNGIIAGSNNTLTPGGSASRAQVAQMLMSYLKVYQQ